MTAEDINALIDAGANSIVRTKIKKLSIEPRMKLLQACIPYVDASPKNLRFFKENFAKEIGALIMTDGDAEEATRLYRSAKK